ncbi:MAG: DtxR family transcriptional regulator [Deltaproteobacteria bacterium]|uniref:DtxR family transcriptional regulator n=1 Tax=Candidatus Zymogenus saltonus TaxID=2844893 RepID=A0A9D8PP40_9DELT|nr:DtxR family transcriptional regulator [Candidatus Zymogenus saltonus]
MYSGTLTASMEDYLEAIFHIMKEKQAVRPKEIAKRLKVTNASVTGALRSLAEKKLINYAPYDVITLTREGRVAAKDVIRRHEVLRDFFVNVLAVDEKNADKAACQMEHSIPKIILERFIQFADFIELCPRAGSKWITGYGYSCDYGRIQDNCDECIERTLNEVKKRNLKGGAKTMEKISLRDLQPGQKCKVLSVKSDHEANKRIVEMGVTPGAVIEIERVAPLGDPIDIKVRGYHLSLRKDEVEDIEVESL